MKSNGKKLHDAVDHMGVLDICIHINVYCSNVNRNWHLEKKVCTKASTTVEFIAYIQYQQPAPINTYTLKPSVHGSSTCEWCFQYLAGFFSLLPNSILLRPSTHMCCSCSYSDHFSKIINHFPLFNVFNETVYRWLRCSNMH